MWGARGKRSAGGLLIALGLVVAGCAAEEAAPRSLAGGAGTAKSSVAPGLGKASAVPSGEPAASATGKPSSAASSAPAAPATTPIKPAPKVVTKNIVVIRSVPFKKKNVKDPELPQGEMAITTRGVKGVKRLTYAVTYTDGRETARRLVRQVITTQPVTQVSSIGTKADEPEPGGCDPNYTGCVPIASDVDCSSGSGNGPAYVEGPVEVIGDDIYGLDRDHDGIGCEDG